MFPLLAWCGINLSVLGTPAPAVDLGYNLFGSTAQLPWPKLTYSSPEEETFEKLLAARRAQAPGDLFEFLNTRAMEVSVQDYNIWAAATPICEELGFSHLECENRLRNIAFEVVRMSPINYLEYVLAQIRLGKNRWNFEVTLWVLIFSFVLSRLSQSYPESLVIAKVGVVLSVFTLLTAVSHAALAQLYLRYISLATTCS